MNEIAEDQTIARLAPIIRIHKRCVPAIDDSGILQGRLSRSRRLTEAMCQPDGRAALQAGLSRVRRVNWDQIKSIVIAAPTAAPFLSGFWRITARHSQGRMEIKVPPHDAGHVLAAIEHFAMEKCQHRSGLRGHVTIGGITLFLVALLAGPPLLGALLGYDRLDDPAFVEPINALYRDCWEPLDNYFLPSAKLERKSRRTRK